MFSDGYIHRLGIDALKDHLHSKHNLSYLYCREAIQFPHGNLDQSPLLTLLSFLSLWASGHQKPKVARGKSELPVQWSVCAALGRSAPSSETKTPRPAELNVAGAGSKNVSSRSLGVIVSGTISFSTP